jgi:hypothetical protein
MTYKNSPKTENMGQPYSSKQNTLSSLGKLYELVDKTARIYFSKLPA